MELLQTSEIRSPPNIPQRLAARIDTFCREHLNPYVNLHRPSMFAKEIVDTKGKVRKTYPHDMVQPRLEKLARLADAQQYLRPGRRPTGQGRPDQRSGRGQRHECRP